MQGQEPEIYTLKGNLPLSLFETIAFTKFTPLVLEGLKVVERFFQVPLDYSNPLKEEIVIFARQTIPLAKAKTKEDEDKLPFGMSSAIPLPIITGGRLKTQCCTSKAR
jgi:hypothetical protein